MSDNDFLAYMLKDGFWHSHTELLARSIRERGRGLTIHSRAADLRKRGHRVEVRLDRDGGGRARSFYRLVTLNELAVEDSASGWSPAETQAGGAAEFPQDLSAAGSLSVPPAAQPLADSSVDRPPLPVDPGGTLQLFACHVDESAGLRGAYGDAA